MIIKHYCETKTKKYVSKCNEKGNVNVCVVFFALIGVNDDGTISGIEHAEQVCLDIENGINDSISPKPDFELRIEEANKTIHLLVREGEYKPYLYKGKAYRRSDSATIEVDQAELRNSMWKNGFIL